MRKILYELIRLTRTKCIIPVQPTLIQIVVAAIWECNVDLRFMLTRLIRIRIKSFYTYLFDQIDQQDFFVLISYYQMNLDERD
jgi:hypothetical protein